MKLQLKEKFVKDELARLNEVSKKIRRSGSDIIKYDEEKRQFILFFIVED
jgi:hypothetical protein